MRDGGPPLAPTLAFNQYLALVEDLGMSSATLIATRSAPVTADHSTPDPAAGRHDERRDGRMCAPVLVVEADDGTRSLISGVLAEAGYEVLPTADGLEALAAIKLMHDQSPSVVVVDATLPVMDAAAFLRAYRQLPGPHAPAVILTDQPPESFDAPTGPVAAVLPKPVAFEELLAVVRRYTEPDQT